MNVERALNLLCPYQKAWLRDDAPLAIGEKSRRIGWTWTHALGVVLTLASQPPERPLSYWHSSADMTASSEFIDNMAEWVTMVNAVATFAGGAEVVDEQHGISAFVMRFANGSKAVAGSSNPKFFRSKGGPAGLDEFAFHRDGRELYKAAHATAMFWGYKLRVWSTHNGPNSYFAQLLNDARAINPETGRPRLKASVHTVTVVDAVEQGIVERIDMRKRKLAEPPPPDARRRQEWLDELRSTCPDEDTWNEEYMCRPADDAGSLLSYELIGTAMADNHAIFASPNDLPRDQGILYAGYDVGRRHDFAVGWVAELVGDVLSTRMLTCFDRASFQTQEAWINALMANPRVRRICIDESGIGAQLAETAMRRFGSRAEGVTLSGPVKASLGLAFRDRFADRQIRIPSAVTWEEFDADDRINRIVNRRNMTKRRLRGDWLKEDLHKTKRSVTAAGNVRLAADSDADGHADGFWAGALMNEAAGSKSAPLPMPLAQKPAGW